MNKIDQLARLDIVEHHPFFSTSADKYFKWAPDATVLSLDALGIKTRHKFADHVKILIVAELIQKMAVEGLKHTTHELRPNGLNFHSFPSGHTATCFMGAEILRRELADHKIVAWSGYLLAAATAVLRLYKNKHWVSDVIAGGVLGTLSVVATYAILKKWKQSRRDKQR